MYIPRYLITNNILKFVGQVEASKEVVENAPLVPDYVKQFKTDAIVRTVYHGTQIEGNDLTLEQAKQVIEGESIVAKERDIQEVINYRHVMKMLDELSEADGGYNVTTLLNIHRAVVYNVVADEKAGVLRDTQVVIKEQGSGNVILKPPPAVEVPYQLNDFFAWLNNPASRQIHPVIRAGIVHYVLVAIHPFVDGNGRTARAIASLVLMREGYDIKRFFSIEEHFDRDLQAYYDAFFKVDQQSEDISARDLTPWLEYFTSVVATELNKIKEKVRKLSMDSRLKLKIGEQVALSKRQVKLVEYMSEHGEAKMSDLTDVLPMVSEDTVLRDVNNLIDKGIVEKEGKTKAARYLIRRK